MLLLLEHELRLDGLGLRLGQRLLLLSLPPSLCHTEGFGVLAAAILSGLGLLFDGFLLLGLVNYPLICQQRIQLLLHHRRIIQHLISRHLILTLLWRPLLYHLNIRFLLLHSQSLAQTH